MLPPGTDIRAVGTENQTTLIWRPAKARVYEFAPAIDTFLKEHLFGEIFLNGPDANWQQWATANSFP